MSEVVISRTLLKNPAKCIGVLMLAALTFEGFNWLFAYPTKIKLVEDLGGAAHYIWAIVRGLLLPEICTLFILLLLLDVSHDLFRLKRLELAVKSVLYYEFKLLPVLLVAYFVFNPVTQTVRYLLEQFPHYDIDEYLRIYLLGTFKARVYLFYVIPVLLMGYGTVNSSLLVDILEQRRRNKRRTAPVEPVAPAVSDPTRTVLTHVRAKNNNGEILIPVQECYWFETEERNYYAVHPTGRFAVTKTLNELETELSPDHFFRLRRDCIINLSFVAGYSYWEKGKYIVKMHTPENNEFDMPKARLQEFRNRLGYHQGPVPETSLS